MADYAILQEIDKCMKCRGCQVACQRIQNLGAVSGNAATVQFDDPMVVKTQRSNDAPPYVRYSCWHCINPPCVSTCPLGAMKKDNATGAIYVDQGVCNPNNCQRQCVSACWQGGYPKVGVAENGYHAYKCHMCYNRASGPACVETCPAKALKYDTLAAIQAYITANYGAGSVVQGTGHIFWASNNGTFDPPKTDPFIEDHISPMTGKVLKGPFAAMLSVPALLFGGLYALHRRREALAESKES